MLPHVAMHRHICAGGELSECFPITTGVKEGCVIAPVLFMIFFRVMLNKTLLNCDKGIYIRFRTNSNIFNISRLNAKTKVYYQLVRDLLFADDCILFSHTEKQMQTIVNNFSSASKWCEIGISIKKM